MVELWKWLIPAVVGLAATPAFADSPSGTGFFGEGGKLLATGGVSQVEGAAGGGLVPWAVIGGYESRASVGFTLHQDIFGAKVRVIGDAVYDQDSWLPQVAVGLQYKHSNDAAVDHDLGAK